MEFDLYELSDKINKYFYGEISKSDLGTWGEKAFYALLKGEYVENKKIVLYPFLKIVSRIHLEENDIADVYPSTDDDLKYIQAILMGDMTFSFQVTVSVPSNIYANSHCKFLHPERVKIFSEVKYELDKLISGEKNTSLDLKLADIFKMSLLGNTVLDTLQGYIMQFCGELFDDNSFTIKPPLRLYAHKENANLGLVKLKNMIECYIGDRNFIVTVLYEKGKPQLSIFC